MELFSYLLKVSTCSVLFFAFYLLVLRKLTFFKINRFYLLGSLLLSFIVPALQIKIEREATVNTAINQPIASQDINLGGSSFKTPIVVGTGPITHEELPVDWYMLLPYLYGGIVSCLLLLAAWRLFQLLKHTNAPVKEINGLKLVAKKKGFTNCSFFNYVFIDENSLTKAELAVLLAHEEVHAKQYHSADKLVLMLAKAVLWFNPVIYLYDKALEEVHEYEADDRTSQNIGTEIYATLLLKLAASKSSNPFIHNFVKSPIKQRIKMLFNSKSKNMKKLSYLLALPIGLGLVWMLATEVVYAGDKSLGDKAVSVNDKPFIERVKSNKEGYTYEKITINSPGKPLTFTIAYFGKDLTTKKLWFLINNKLYTEAEVQKLDAVFVNGLSSNKGYSNAMYYAIPGVEQRANNTVVWFGSEPKLSEFGAKNKEVYEKYNGTTVNGTVLEYSYSPSNKSLIDGFMFRTDAGEILMAKVEAKFASQTKGMFKEGDKLTLKVYKSAHWQGTDYPVITSYKLMKGDKVLFDRLPKTADIQSSNSIKTKGLFSAKVSSSSPKDQHKDYEFSAQDSTVFDKGYDIVHLYGKARLKNNREEIFADEIHYNLKTKKHVAVGLTDSKGKKMK